MPTKTQTRLYLSILSVSVLCWVLGLVLPMIYVRPYPEFISVGIEPYQMSTGGTIVMLFEKHYTFAGVVLCACSIVIPFFKCIALFLILSVYMGWMNLQRTVSHEKRSTADGKSFQLAAGSNWPPDLTRFIALFSGYQFVDIFVGLLFLSFCNTPEVHSSLLSGYYFFLAYCLLSTFVVHALLDEDVQLSSEMRAVDVSVVQANLLALAFLFALGFGEPMLDVAYTFHGIAMGRSRMGLLGMTYQLATYAHPILGIFFIVVTVVIPIILGITYLLAANYLSVLKQREAMAFANFVHKFAMTDVFCLALITFLFSVQGSHVTSTVPNGSFFSLFYTEWLSGFYVALGYGAAVFTLKWRALHAQTDDSVIARYYGLPNTQTLVLYDAQQSFCDLQVLNEPFVGPSSSHDLRAIHPGDNDTPTSTDGRKRHGGTGGADTPSDVGMYPCEDSEVLTDHRITIDSPFDPERITVATGTSASVPPPAESRLRKLMRNPIFHIKLTSWIIWGICYFCIHAPPPLTFMSVNSAVNHMLPFINEAIENSLPTTFGNCSDYRAPKPCVGDHPLYQSGRDTTNQITVRWASGLNTIKLNHVAVQIIPDSEYPIQMQIQGVLQDMSASIQVKNCMMLGCQTLWDNAQGCCGKNRNFDLVVAGNCVDQEGSFTAASIGNFKVEWFSIEAMVVSESVLGVNVKVTDVTPAVESAVRRFLTDYLRGNKTIPQSGAFTFTKAVQRVWEYNINERRLKCQEMLEQL